MVMFLPYGGLLEEVPGTLWSMGHMFLVTNCEVVIAEIDVYREV